LQVKRKAGKNSLSVGCENLAAQEKIDSSNLCFLEDMQKSIAAEGFLNLNTK